METGALASGVDWYGTGKLVIGCVHDIFALAPFQPAQSEMRSRKLVAAAAVN